MRSSIRFVAAAVGVVLAGTLVALPFLADGGRRALLVAAALALGTQIPVHFLLRNWRTRAYRFMAAAGAGFASKVAVIVLGVVLFVVPGRAEPAPFLLSLGGFLVSLVIAESWLAYRYSRAEAVARR